MSRALIIIKGDSHTDERGTVSFVNDFDMTLVKRFYKIKHPSIQITRGWRGHKIEQRWFHVISGAFEFKVVEVDNWETPSRSLMYRKFVVSADESAVLHIPAGYASAIKAMEMQSEVIVFADYSVEHSKNDDFLFPLDYFNHNNNEN